MKNKIDELPDTTGEFSIDLIGSVTKKRFLGEFVCKLPTIKDQAKIAVYESSLNGEFPMNLNSGVLNIHKKIAYLRFTLIDIPKFWRDSDLGYDLRDPNIIDAVYTEVLSFEDRWVKDVWGEEVVDGQKEEN
jgi:hypothetical protein